MRKRYRDGKNKLPDFQHHTLPCPVHPGSIAAGKTHNCRECIIQYKRLIRKKFGIPIKDQWLRDRAQARRRGQTFELTLEEFSNIRKAPCAYRIGKQAGVRVGIDRRNSKKGYTLKNSVPCCWRHNLFKNNILTYEQTLDAVQRYGIKCGNAPRRGSKLEKD
jgi:hypothetical protein